MSRDTGPYVKTCVRCLQVVSEDRIAHYNDGIDPVCERCAENLVTCTGCGDLIEMPESWSPGDVVLCLECWMRPT